MVMERVVNPRGTIGQGLQAGSGVLGRVDSCGVVDSQRLAVLANVLTQAAENISLGANVLARSYLC
jgi:hypothetical protein